MEKGKGEEYSSGKRGSKVQRLRASGEHFTFWLLSELKTPSLKETHLGSALGVVQGVLMRPFWGKRRGCLFNIQHGVLYVIEAERCLLSWALFHYRLGSYFHSLSLEKDAQYIRADPLILILSNVLSVVPVLTLFPCNAQGRPRFLPGRPSAAAPEQSWRNPRACGAWFENFQSSISAFIRRKGQFKECGRLSHTLCTILRWSPTRGIPFYFSPMCVEVLSWACEVQWKDHGFGIRQAWVWMLALHLFALYSWQIT